MRGQTPLKISIFENQCHMARPSRHMHLLASLPTGNVDLFLLYAAVSVTYRKASDMVAVIL
jgi:hypothetical protein